MERSNLIQVETGQWIVMRENPNLPKAIVHQVTDTGGVARFMVMVWQSNPAERRMAGIYESLQAAEASVPWTNPRPVLPGPPGMSGEAAAANMRARGVDGTGMPPGVPHPARRPAAQ